MKTWLARFARDEGGATAVEYAVLIAFMILIMLGAVTLFADATSEMFNTAMDTIRAAMGG